MGLAVGEIFVGKVTGITKFGAFVSLPENKSGMVHISEVANTFVDDIKNFLKEGQEVRVKVMAIDEQGRINLSIKKAQENVAPPQQRTQGGHGNGGNRAPQRYGDRPPQQRASRPAQPRFDRDSKGDDDDDDRPLRSSRRVAPTPRNPEISMFEEQMKMYMTTSEIRKSESRHGNDRKNGKRRK